MSSCFYCGGNHYSSYCPFELQREGSNALQNTANRQLDSIESVEEATHHLSETFQMAHAEAMWMAEKQIQLLTGIYDMLKNPRATAAEELLRMGVNSLRIGMIEKSINLLKEAEEKNPLDYRIYIALGHAHLRNDDYKNAINCFEYALKNGRTKKYQCFALLLIAQANYSIDQIENAIQASKIASEICTDSAKAQYLCAVYMTAKISSHQRPLSRYLAPSQNF